MVIDVPSLRQLSLANQEYYSFYYASVVLMKSTRSRVA